MAKKNEITVTQPVVEPANGAGRDLVNQLLGQAQALEAAGSFLRTFGITKLALVKENKLYQQLKGVRAPNGSEFRGTWDEFCGLLGMSVDKADADIANVRAFGEQALEQMQRAGIGYRELRQFRRLPDDEQKALTEVAAAGDQVALLELAETIIAKNVKDKAELRQELADVEKARTNLAVDLQKAEAERDGLAKQLKRRRREEEDGDGGVPIVVADIRAEMAALIKKAGLSITSMHGIGMECVGLSAHDQGHLWIAPTLRFGMSGLLALREEIDGLIQAYAKAMGEDFKRLQSQPSGLAFLDENEIRHVAEEWAALTATHQHEEALRKHEREQAKPKGRGRPKSAPKAGE